MVNTYICHHGVKGMHWGVRRYQNYDGRYTQAGLARYKESVSDYNKNKQKYKDMKKEGGYSSHELKVQKGKIKAFKKQADRRYDLLKSDKLADKGRVRYEEGERILERNSHTKNISKAAAYSTSVGTLMIAKPELVNSGMKAATTILSGGAITGSLSLASIPTIGTGLVVAGTVAGAIATGKYMIDQRKNKEISAYYSHRYRR